MTATTAPRRRRRRSPEERRPSDLLVLAPLAVVLVVIVFPILWMFYSALRPAGSLASGFEWGTALTELSLDSFRRLFSATSFERWLGNSLVICATATVLSVIVASVAGYGLSRYRFRWRTTMQVGLVATQLLPFVVLITPVYLFFAELRLVNTYVGLVIVYVAMTLPLGTLLMTGFFSTIPTVLDEAARVDGASTLTVLARIIAPLVWPGVVTVAVTSFIGMWEEFLFAQVLLTDDSLRTAQVGLAGLFGEYATDWGVVMAASAIATIPTIVLFSLLQRRLVAGMAVGAVKG